MSTIIKPPGIVQPQMVVPYNPLKTVYTVLDEYYYGIDHQAVRIAMGSLARHFGPKGNPTWLFIQGAPSTGKTVTMIAAATKLPGIHQISDVNENTFLSGFYGHDAPGLLENLGRQVKTDDKNWHTNADGIFLFQDFNSILAKPPNIRYGIYGQFREMYDGKTNKRTGTGVTKHWQGRITVLAAVTNNIEEDFLLMVKMGMRFMSVRWPRMGWKSGYYALLQRGKEGQIEDRLSAATMGMFNTKITDLPAMSHTQMERLAKMAEFVALARTAIKMDKERELHAIPDPEGCGRMAKAMDGVASGVSMLHRRTELSEQDIFDAVRLGFDSIPIGRARVLKTLVERKPISAVELPRVIAQKAAAELHACGLINYDTDSFTSIAKELLEAIGRENIAAIGKETT